MPAVALYPARLLLVLVLGFILVFRGLQSKKIAAVLERCCWKWLGEEISRLLVRAHMLHFYDATFELLTNPLTCDGDMLESL